MMAASEALVLADTLMMIPSVLPDIYERLRGRLIMQRHGSWTVLGSCQVRVLGMDSKRRLERCW
jgi:hypothetical protein